MYFTVFNGMYNSTSKNWPTEKHSKTLLQTSKYEFFLNKEPLLLKF